MSFVWFLPCRAFKARLPQLQESNDGVSVDSGRHTLDPPSPAGVATQLASPCCELHTHAHAGVRTPGQARPWIIDEAAVGGAWPILCSLPHFTHTHPTSKLFNWEDPD